MESRNSITGDTFSVQECNYLSRMMQYELQSSLVTRIFAVAAADDLKLSGYDVGGPKARGERDMAAMLGGRGSRVKTEPGWHYASSTKYQVCGAELAG